MDFVEQLKSSIDIVKVAGEYVRLRRVGATGRYLGLCPFHQEKTPSFNVNQTRQFYKCFGCGAGGDVLKFVMEVDGLTFPETLKLLSERHGIPMPQRPEYSDADSRLRGALHDMHALAAKLYRGALNGPHGGDARTYLDQRGVSVDLIEAFDLGYSDPQGQALTRKLTEERFSPEQMEASGLVRRRTEGSGFYDAFRGRLMFPIHNESGKVIAFGARAMGADEQPKYLNSPETPIYRKTSTLYNLHRARDAMRKANRAVLVEGYMDVIGVHAAGIKEVVASCGTALTNTQVRALHRHADTVVVNFDPDDAGANAAERAIQLLLDEGLHVKVLAFGGGSGDANHAKLDPYEYVKQFGAEAYRSQLDSASSYFHWLADRARARFDMRGADGRMDAFKFLMPAVQKISDKLERAAVASDLAGYLGVPPEMVLQEMKKAATNRHAPGQLAARPAGSASSGAPPIQVPAVERILLNALLSSEETRQRILPELPAELTTDFVSLEVMGALRQMAEAGPVNFAALDARLSAPGRALLHDIVSADEIQDDAECLAQAEACLQRLRTTFQRRRMEDVRARIRTAEREGNPEQALHWMAELQRVEEEVKSDG
ncbi:MAG: DNA primase [Acidobacteriota bacterium]